MPSPSDSISTTRHPNGAAARRGRPRDPERSRAILESARTLLREGGWDALTFEAVASSAGVGRPTVYRRWPTKGHLAAEVLATELAEHTLSADDTLDLRDTRPLDEELGALVRILVERLTALEHLGIHPGVIAEMALDEDLARRVRTEVLIPDRDRVAEAIQIGIDRGQIRPDLDPCLVVDALAAQVIFFLYVVHEPLDDALMDRIADLVAYGCEVRS